MSSFGKLKWNDNDVSYLLKRGYEDDLLSNDDNINSRKTVNNPVFAENSTNSSKFSDISNDDFFVNYCNTSTHQHITASTHINTHQHINTSTHQHINTSTHQHINTLHINTHLHTSTHQHTNISTHQHIRTLKHQHINSSTQSTHQHINTSTHQHKRSKGVQVF